MTGVNGNVSVRSSEFPSQRAAVPFPASETMLVSTFSRIRFAVSAKMSNFAARIQIQ